MEMGQSYDAARLLAEAASLGPAPRSREAAEDLLGCLRASYPAVPMGCSCPPGWARLVEACCRAIVEALPPEALAGARLDEWKEKYGSWRWDIVAPATTPDQRASLTALLDDALVAASERTCEECGRSGRLRIGPGGWWTPLCDEHGSGKLLLEDEGDAS